MLEFTPTPKMSFDIQNPYLQTFEPSQANNSEPMFNFNANSQSFDTNFAPFSQVPPWQSDFDPSSPFGGVTSLLKELLTLKLGASSDSKSEYTCSNNQAVNKALSQVGHKGGEAYGAGKQAWCAGFVSWAYGGKNAPWGQQLSVAEIKKWAVNNGKYKKGNSFDGVKPGDLVVWRPDTSGRSHVGIVASIENGKIKTVEGNTSGDVVNTRSYDAGTNFDGFVSV